MPTFPRDSSDSLKAHIKAAEKLMLTAYLDAAGVPTIGWGHTAGVARADVGVRKITEARALALFEADLDIAENVVRRLVKVDLSPNQFDALVDFVFNVGAGNFANSTLLSRLNDGDYAEVPAQLMRWTKARDPKTGKLRELPGLVTRRSWEAQLWARTLSTPAVPSYPPDATTSAAPTRKNTSLWGLIVALVIPFAAVLLGGSHA